MLIQLKSVRTSVHSYIDHMAVFMFQGSKRLVSIAVAVGCLTAFGALLSFSMYEKSTEEHFQNHKIFQKTNTDQNNISEEQSR